MIFGAVAGKNSRLPFARLIIESIQKKEVKVMAEDMKKARGVGSGIGFERIRRITGYLVGTVDRFNDAKKAEVHDRVKHGCAC